MLLDKKKFEEEIPCPRKWVHMYSMMDAKNNQTERGI